MKTGKRFSTAPTGNRARHSARMAAGQKASGRAISPANGCRATHPRARPRLRCATALITTAMAKRTRTSGRCSVSHAKPKKMGARAWGCGCAIHIPRTATALPKISPPLTRQKTVQQRRASETVGRLCEKSQTPPGNFVIAYSYTRLSCTPV